MDSMLFPFRGDNINMYPAVVKKMADMPLKQRE